ncbi:hypothetical protein LguiA_003336 [Lonicera macranthoides]
MKPNCRVVSVIFSEEKLSKIFDKPRPSAKTQASQTANASEIREEDTMTSLAWGGSKPVTISLKSPSTYQGEPAMFFSAEDIPYLSSYPVMSSSIFYLLHP